MDDDEEVLSGGSDSYLPTDEEEEEEGEESEGGGGGDGSDDDEEYEEEEATVEGGARAGRDRRSRSSSVPAGGDECRKSKNIDALVRGNLVVRRQALLPRVLSVTEGAAVCRKPFKPPCTDGYGDRNGKLHRRLSARKRFVPWGSSRPALMEVTNQLNWLSSAAEKDVEDEKVELPPGVEPLVLWQPEDSEVASGNAVLIEVDPLLVRFLRPHQREGVQFMFECVSGLSGNASINGCILADDMGLGKTLQSITLLYTLLRQGFDGKPMVKKAIIVTPTSLVSNWEAEISKWLGERIQLIALCESTRDDVISGIDRFTSPHSSLQVLIVSYETFRMHSSKFSHSESCELLICDEAHRLKNDQTLTNRALAALSCRRRILLSGTPMQNDLEEFFAMVNFTNPGILGEIAYFRRYYEAPIICGREPTASEEEKNLGCERSAELSAIVNQFILRRTNALLSNHLPPKYPVPVRDRIFGFLIEEKFISLTQKFDILLHKKMSNSRDETAFLFQEKIIEVVCCKLSPLQTDLYNHFIHSKNVKRAITEEMKQSKILAYITALKKLCNHPKLIYDTVKSGSPGTSGFEDCVRFFPSEMFSGRSGSWSGGDGAWVELSGKMHVLARLLAHLRQQTDDRIVLVSNYTQTLDLFAQLCRERRYPYLRLDGTTTISKRQKLVNRFNDPSKDEFVFLLSSKAGGCGLNLIGGNRLVLFDPDWNPANDKQAAARVWRDGQKKRVYIYRFLSAGTIEEKVYQRQISKEGLQKVIQQETSTLAAEGNCLSTEELRDLFTFHEKSRSEIHEKMNCIRCQHIDDTETTGDTRDSALDRSASSTDTSDIGSFAEIAGCLHKLKASEKQIGTPKEEDLGSWGHHFSATSVPDILFQASAGDEVSFVFTNQVDGKLVPIETAISEKIRTEESRLDLKHLMNQKARLEPQRLKVQQSRPSSLAAVRSSPTITSQGSERRPLKIILKGTGLAQSRNKLTLAHQLPQKRPCDGSLEHDDDFL